MKPNNRIAAWKQCLHDSCLFAVRWQVLAGTLCAVILAVGVTGVCWAWFDTSVRTQQQQLSVAPYTLDITVKKQSTTQLESVEDETGGATTEQMNLLADPAEATQPVAASQEEIVSEQDGSYSLESGGIYTITLTATGESTGYAVLTVSNDKESAVCRTPEIQAGEGATSVSLTLMAKEAGTLQITPMWGTIATGESAQTEIAAEKWYQVLNGSNAFEEMVPPTVPENESQEETNVEQDKEETDSEKEDTPLEEPTNPDSGEGNPTSGTTTSESETTEDETGIGKPDSGTAGDTADGEEGSGVTTEGPETDTDATKGDKQPSASGGEEGVQPDVASSGSTTGKSDVPAVQNSGSEGTVQSKGAEVSGKN